MLTKRWKRRILLKFLSPKKKIDGLWDIVLEGRGREEIEQKYQRANGSSSSRLTSAGGTFLVGEGGQRYQVSPGINPMFADVSKLTHSGKLVVRREELDAFATLVREQAPPRGFSGGGHPALE